MIKNNLRVIMAVQKRNISDLAIEAGVSRNTLTSLYHERGQGVKFETLDKICMALNCGISDLLEYVPNEKQVI